MFMLKSDKNQSQSAVLQLHIQTKKQTPISLTLRTKPHLYRNFFSAVAKLSQPASITAP